jgi:hypothetical protein
MARVIFWIALATAISVGAGGLTSGIIYDYLRLELQ